MALTKRKLIRYAGYEPPRYETHAIPVKRAIELRERGMSWKVIAQKLAEELDLDVSFTADGVYAAVYRERKREMA